MAWEVVDHFAVGMVFPKVAKYLDSAIKLAKATDWSLPSLFGAINRSDVYLAVDNLLDPNYVLTFRFVNWGGELTCLVMFLGGKEGGQFDWGKSLKLLKEYIATRGCSRICGHVREGITRKLKVKKLAILCEFDLEAI